jgi:fucose permease
VARETRWVPVTIVALAFVALGLPDGALGVAWPSMRRDFALPVSGFGVLILIMMAGHLVASVGSGPAAVRVGAARLLLWSNLAFAAGAFGIAFAPGWWALMLAGLVAGAAAGLIDAGLNAYAAARFSPGVITSLHACFGAGATLGPLLLGRFLEHGRSWRGGYGVIAGALIAMTLTIAFTRRALDGDGADRPPTEPALPSVPRLAETLRHPGVWLGAVLFCLYTGLEATPGRWAYSLLAEARGMAPERAAIAAAAYWGGMSLGRASWGAAARWLAPRVVLRACLACAPLGALLVWAGSGSFAALGLVVLGVCFAPVFPLLTALTSDRVGADHAGHAIGLQVAAASLGGGVLPGGIGLVARRAGLEVVGPFLFVAALVTLALYEVVEARTRRASAANSGPVAAA